MLTDLWDWLVDVFWHWQRWAGGSGIGGAIVVFLGIYQQLTGRVMAKRMYVAIFIVGFLFFAFFSAWREQRNQATRVKKELEDFTITTRKQMDGLQNQLDELKTPIIKANFTNTPIVGEYQSDKRDTELILGLNIFNTGAPTALYGFKLRIVLPNGTSFDVSPLPVTVKPLEITGPRGGTLQQISTEHYLPTKVLTPIPRNGIVNGYLPYRVAVRPEEFAKTPADLFLAFADVNGKPYLIQGKWTP